MKKIVVILFKVISILLAVFISLALFAIYSSRYDSKYKRTPMYDYISPDSAWTVSFTEVGERYDYKENDEITILDASGTKASVITMIVQGKPISKSCYDVSFEGDGIRIRNVEESFSFYVRYDELNGRDIRIVNVAQCVYYVELMVLVVFPVITGILLFDSKHRKVFASIMSITVLLFMFLSYAFEVELRDVNLIDLDSSSNGTESVLINNIGYKLCRGKWDEISVYTESDNYHPIFEMYVINEGNEEYVISFDKDDIHIVMSDDFEFDLIREVL